MGAVGSRILSHALGTSTSRIVRRETFFNPDLEPSVATSLSINEVDVSVTKKKMTRASSLTYQIVATPCFLDVKTIPPSAIHPIDHLPFTLEGGGMTETALHQPS
jgi:hypothetical protein